ncbi:MAG: A24 family peptidase [bacterium]|nr:A24 family peptidase [bacterium]
MVCRGQLGSTYYLLHTIRWYLLSILVVLFVYDLRYGLVPDRVVLPAIGVAALYTVILSRAKDLFTMQGVGSLHSARASVEMTIGGILLAITIGAGFFALQYYLSRGRWLGAGDIRIGALMGAIVGWPLIFEALVISYLIGGLFAGILLILRKKQFGQTLPLGTFLTLGTVITILYGQQIWSWYWHI